MSYNKQISVTFSVRNKRQTQFNIIPFFHLLSRTEWEKNGSADL